MTKKKTKTAIERIDTIRGHKTRRLIVQAALEAHTQGRLVSPGGMSRQLKRSLQGLSYHVKILREEGILELVETIPRRGAFEHIYALNQDYLAEITDSVALDRIAEWYEAGNGHDLKGLEEIIRSTGRPVEA